MHSTSNGFPYASQQEAHDDLMAIAAEVVRDIVAAGGKPPSPSKMLRDFDRLWDVWKLFADPRGNYGAPSTRARLANGQ